MQSQETAPFINHLIYKERRENSEELRNVKIDFSPLTQILHYLMGLEPN